MGRWGYMLFEGDTDADILCSIDSKLREHLKISESNEDFYALTSDPKIFLQLKTGFDTDGFGSTLLQQSRGEMGLSKGRSGMADYDSMMVSAVMMNCGAKITAEERVWLNEVWETIPKLAGNRYPLNDYGFRKPGGMQYKFALAHYIDGQPWDFDRESCYGCGNHGFDQVDFKLKQCSRCAKNKGRPVAGYCGKACQKADWKAHKQICRGAETRGGFSMLNV